MNGRLRFSHRVRSFGFLLILLSSRSVSQDTVSISDFRYPESRAIDWKGGFNGSLQQGTVEWSGIPSSSLSGYSARQGTETGNSSEGDYNANTTFLFFHSKENHDHTFQLTASGSFSHYRNDDVAIDTVLREEENVRDNWSAGFTENWLYLHYLSDEGFHFLGSIATTYHASGSESDRYSNRFAIFANDHEIDRSYTVSFRGSLGIGYGRLRDGTFVFRALRIVERLREDGLITRPLSRAEMLGVVDRIARKREYTTNFERPDKYFVRDIVNELTEVGVIAPGAVTPYSTLRIVEGFQENLALRMFGWRFYYAINDVHDQHKSETYYSNYYSDAYSDGWAHIHEFGFEFGHPITLFTHLSGRCLFDVPVHEHETQSTFSASATISHQVGERLEIDGNYEFLFGLKYVPVAGITSYARSTVHTVRGNFVYFLEDRLRFVTELTYGNSYDHIYGAVLRFQPEVMKSSRITLSFGIFYNII